MAGSIPRQIAYAQKRPPNMRISVAMKTHMPSFAAWNCCAGVSKWCCRKSGWASEWPSCAAGTGAGTGSMTFDMSPLFLSLGRFLDLVPPGREFFRCREVIVVRAAREDRRRVVVAERRRRVGHPLVSGGTPRVTRCLLAPPEGLEEGVGRREEADGEDPRAYGGGLVKRLKLRQVVVIPSGHAARAHDELRNEHGIETDEDEPEADLCFPLVVHLSGHLGPPVEQAPEKGDDGASHHDVVEMGNDEVRVRQVHVDAE